MMEVRRWSTPPDFWSPVPIEPSTLLQSLRTGVEESFNLRVPKWRFKVGDIGLEIQPKFDTRNSSLLFHCQAIKGEGITLDWFKNRKLRPDSAGWIQFYIRTDPETSQWLFKACGVSEHGVPLKSFLVDTFSTTLFERAALFTWSCVICGKPLIDPVSRARLIGPECAGKSSLVVPLHLAPDVEAALTGGGT